MAEEIVTSTDTLRAQSRCKAKESAACVKTCEILDETLSRERKSPFLRILLSAMESRGCAVLQKHFVVEDCKSFDGYGGFDAANNEIVLCENKFASMSRKRALKEMHSTLAHELVHAFDHCRGNIDFYDNPKHVICSEIRAAALSGQCTLANNFSSAVFGKSRRGHQRCVKSQALRSFKSLHPEWSTEKSMVLIDELFTKCYGDTEPFDRIPLSLKDAHLSFKAYLSRNRYDP